MPDNNVRLNVEQIEERTLPSGTVGVVVQQPVQIQTNSVMVDSGGNVVSNNNNSGQPVVVAAPPAPPPGNPGRR